MNTVSRVVAIEAYASKILLKISDVKGFALNV